jgi:hypothetical protein
LSHAATASSDQSIKGEKKQASSFSKKFGETSTRDEKIHVPDVELETEHEITTSSDEDDNPVTEVIARVHA